MWFLRSLTVYVAVMILYPVDAAYAYLDPGTGSMILQLLLGGVAGALLVGKLYFHKIRSFFTDFFNKKPRN